MRKHIYLMLMSLALMPITLAVAQTRISVEDMPEAGEFNFENDVVILALEGGGGHPRVAVDFGDGQLYQFIVDTGASVNVIDAAVAEKFEFEVTGEIEIGAPNGPQVPGKIVRVDRVQVGGASITNAEFVSMDISTLTRGMSHGVIGLDVFSDYLLTYDLGQSQIRVSRDNLTIGDPAVTKYNNVNGKIQLEMDVAGTTVVSHLDTGSMGDFVLPAQLLQSLPLLGEPQKGPPARMVGGSRDIQYAQLDGAIRFAGLEFDKPRVAFMNPSTGYGNIGGGIYGRYVLSIDQTNQLLAFHKPAVGTVAAAPPRRLGVGFRGMGAEPVLEVSMVAPGSLAETAGFEVGDKLVKVNGQPARDYAMPELGKLFGSQEPLAFEVDRQGVPLNININ